MHLQVLSSGSQGNCTLVRAGNTNLLVDAGLTIRELGHRFEKAGFLPRGLHHLLVTHGHLDHARSSGILGKRHAHLTVHCCERLMGNRALLRAKRLQKLNVGAQVEIGVPGRASELRYTAVKIPHDADPTVAFLLEHEGRRAVILTDMGRPAKRETAPLRDPHLLVLEFNHDESMLRGGGDPPKLKQRILGNGGHLSNEQASQVLRDLAGPNLHTLVLAHLSQRNNTPELAIAAAHATLSELGLGHVEVLVAKQDEIGPNLEV